MPNVSQIEQRLRSRLREPNERLGRIEELMPWRFPAPSSRASKGIGEALTPFVIHHAFN